MDRGIENEIACNIVYGTLYLRKILRIIQNNSIYYHNSYTTEGFINRFHIIINE